jgi:hypothetical protein
MIEMKFAYHVGFTLVGRVVQRPSCSFLKSLDWVALLPVFGKFPDLVFGKSIRPILGKIGLLIDDGDDDGGDDVVCVFRSKRMPREWVWTLFLCRHPLLLLASGDAGGTSEREM